MKTISESLPGKTGLDGSRANLHINLRHLYLDILWFGVLAGSSIAFLNIYLARLGAREFQISLLMAGPAVVNLLFSLPAGRWLAGRPFVTSTFLSAGLTRLGYLALIPLAWLLSESQQVLAVVAIALFMAVPGTLLAISFNAMFAEVVPSEERAEVVGKRNALVAVSMTITTLACGQLLDRIAFPLNYQVVFTLGALGAVMSTYYLGRLRSPRPVQVVEALKPQPGKRRLLRLELLRGRLGRFFAAYMLFYVFQYITLPLFPLAVVNVMKLTDGQISLGNSVFYAVMMLVSLRLSGLTRRFGNHAILSASALGFSLYPLLIGLSKGATLYWAASLLGGAIWALISASMINRLMEVVPAEERPAYMALHNLLLNLGILTGSLMAPALSAQIGLQPALLAGAGLRFLAGILLVLWG